MLFAPLKVQVADGPQYSDTPTLDTKKLLREMKSSKQAAGSACPSVEEYAEQMRRCEECIVVTLSSKLSGSYNSARVAREMVLEESPGKRIHVLDSESASAGELRLAIFLKEASTRVNRLTSWWKSPPALWSLCEPYSSLRIWAIWSKTGG